MAHDLLWEFHLLDRQRKGAIRKEDAEFLFKMVHGEFFSARKFEYLVTSRPVPKSDISFEEIEVELCNIPTYDWMEEIYAEQDRQKEG